MRARTLIDSYKVLLIALVLALGAAGNAFAGGGPGGGGGGGGHGGGGGGGGHGGGGHAAGAGHGHGGFGHGWGHGGWHGHGPWRGRCCVWGGIGLGWYVPFLPWGFETYWWDGVPYYYAGSTYYVWDDGVGEYQAVEPPEDATESAPAGAQSAAEDPAANSELYAYPKGGQSEEQQAKDRDECRQWATQQSGFDPTKPPAEPGGEQMTKRQAYLRAEAACLEARNYTVR